MCGVLFDEFLSWEMGGAVTFGFALCLVACRKKRVVWVFGEY